jgi:hypothetical protein
MPTEAQRRANQKYQQTEKYKKYRRRYMREYYKKRRQQQNDKININNDASEKI